MAPRKTRAEKAKETRSARMTKSNITLVPDADITPDDALVGKIVDKPTLHIPDTIEETVTELNGTDGLLQANEWKRAAIVRAHTTNNRGKSDANESGNPDSSRKLSYKKFAELGIHGLSDQNTVSYYARNWDDAVAGGYAKPVEPGESVDMPEHRWPLRYNDKQVGAPTGPSDAQMGKMTSNRLRKLIQTAESTLEERGEAGFAPAMRGPAGGSSTMSDEEIADARREHDDLPFDGKHEPDGIDALGIILRVTKDLDALGDEAMPVLEFQGNHGDIDLALERFAKAIERVLGRYSGQMREAVK